MGPHEEGSLNIVTLLLAGRATPYLHNGVVYVGDEDHYVIRVWQLTAECVLLTRFSLSLSLCRHFRNSGYCIGRTLD